MTSTKHKRSSAKKVTRAWRSLFRGEQIVRKLRYAAIPVLITVFVIFGGANGEGLGLHALLLLLCGLICAVCVLGLQLQNLPGSFKWLSGLMLACFALAVVQLIELPTFVWRLLGDRTEIEAGWGLHRLDQNFQQISMAPSRTVTAMFYLLIPAAMLLVTARLGWRATVANLPWTIASLGAASAFLGLLQVLLPSVPELYLYVYTNPGSPAGFFANINQQAIFLLMCMPFTAVLLAKISSKRERSDKDNAILIGAGLLAAIQLVGVLAAGSVAGYLILLPVLGLCFLITQSQRRSFDLRPALLGLVVLFPAILLVAYSPQLSGLGVTSVTNDGPMSRVALADVGFDIYLDHFLFGTGLGTFEPVFKIYEDPETVSLKYANHVHNDYLQWAIEMGAVGLLILIGFLAWLSKKIVGVWRKAEDSSTRLRRAAATAVIVPLLHSFVEYPLRSPSIMALASLCVVVLVLPYVSARRQGGGVVRSDGEPNQLIL